MFATWKPVKYLCFGEGAAIDIIKVSGKPRITAMPAAIAGRVIRSSHTNQSAARLAFETIRVKLSAGSADVDVY